MSEKVIFEFKVDYEEAAQRIIQFRKRIAELKDEKKALEKELQNSPGNDALQRKLYEIDKELKNSTQSMRSYEKELQNIEKINKANAGSLNQLRGQLKMLVAQYDELGEAERKSATGQNLSLKINELKQPKNPIFEIRSGAELDENNRLRTIYLMKINVAPPLLARVNPKNEDYFDEVGTLEPGEVPPDVMTLAKIARLAADRTREITRKFVGKCITADTLHALCGCTLYAELIDAADNEANIYFYLRNTTGAGNWTTAYNENLEPYEITFADDEEVTALFDHKNAKQQPAILRGIDFY